MAIFKKTTTTKKVTPKAVASGAPVLHGGNAHILQHARITEKATVNSMNSVYVFNVAISATKRDIIRTVKSLYNVTPRQVAITTVPSKNVRNRRTGKRGVKTGGKKAYVYLKKGETITIS